MGRGVNIDPNFVMQQQQLAQLQALKQAKNAGAVSGKKALWIIVPVFAAAIAVVLLFSGAFEKPDTVRYRGELYKITDHVIYELPEGYGEAGVLKHVENPKNTAEDMTTSWNLETKLYADPGNPQKAYISTNGKDYREIRKK